jgi:hypothetical protein
MISRPWSRRFRSADRKHTQTQHTTARS